MLAFMLDTNICIYVMRRTPNDLLDRFETNRSAICISSITLSELWFGAEKSERRSQNMVEIKEFATRLRVLAFDETGAAHYGNIRANLERRGTPIGSNDMLIGAHARAANLTLVTNSREFDRMPGLRVENWV